MNEDKNKDKKEISIKDRENSPIISGSVDEFGIFKKDKKLLFVHRKVEKICEAIYIITNHFPDEEPLKWSLRTASNALIIESGKFIHGETVMIAKEKSTLSKIFSQLVSFLEVSRVSGLISSMNLSILIHEIVSLTQYVHEYSSESYFHNNVINSTFFDEQKSDKPVQLSSIGHSVDDRNVLHKGQYPTKDKSVENHTIHSGPTDDEGHERINLRDLKDFSPVAVKKSKRQSIIISLLKRKKEVMIKDITESITDCSEKTIQRELALLVEQGVLKKEGERRWTRYMLTV